MQPEFQRESDVWTQVKKSRLIESVLLGLPLPSFYFSEDPETNKLLVVDGLQRLCAFSDFCITKKLKLKGMQFLTGLEGWTYDKLDRTQIRRIKSLKVTLNTLRKNTPQRVKLVIFQRVNTAGVPLTAQEMRNALYQKKATMLDALCHAIESMWAVKANEESQKYAYEVIRLVIDNLDSSINAIYGFILAGKNFKYDTSVLTH